MEQRTYYSAMVGTALVMILCGIVMVMLTPISLERVAGGMLLVAIGVLVLMALVHLPPPHHIKKSYAPKTKR